jgi:RHS repeat-associated protein
VDDYYPFGLEINRTPYTPKNEYLYNKKELQEEFAEYDYGARFYDPVIGRWTSVDPDAENYKSTSSYAYVLNNPINTIDPDGRDTLKTVYIHATRVSKPKPKPEPEGEPIEVEPIKRRFPPFVLPRPPAFTIPILTLLFVLLPANYDDNEEADHLKRMAAIKLVSTILRYQKQLNEHTLGGKDLLGNSYLNSIKDAQSVLDALHNGSATILSMNAGENRVYVQDNNVTGYYNNNGQIVETHLFLIKGSTTSTVVPIHPSSKTFK